MKLVGCNCLLNVFKKSLNRKQLQARKAGGHAGVGIQPKYSKAVLAFYNDLSGNATYKQKKTAKHFETIAGTEDITPRMVRGLVERVNKSVKK